MTHKTDRPTASPSSFLAPLLASLLALAVSTAGAEPSDGRASGVGDAAAREAFVHPGLLHTEADLERMKEKVAAGEQPWSDGWQTLLESRHAQLDWKPRPLERVVRGGEGQNFVLLANDIHAAYQLALRWRVSGDTVYADKAVDVMNAWSSTLREVTGNSDRFLASGIYGYQFANAAEIMRTYPGWKGSDRRRFHRMMLTLFYPMNHDFLVRHNDAAITNYWANWDLCNIASMQAIGVLCDRRDLYDEAIAYFYEGRGNGAIDKAVYYVHPGNLGQWQEAGRDQGHTTLGVALMGPICETAWNQGDDLYSYGNNRFLAGAEYVAKYNLGHETPYQPYAWGLGRRGDHREQNEISPTARGQLRNGFELVINHYVNRKGLAAPYSSRYADKLRPERGGGGHASTFDQLGLGTLTAVREPRFADPRPTGLTARKSGAAVVLSWWGAAGATSYNVKRSGGPGGPYRVIATGMSDLLTFTDTDPAPSERYYVVTALRRGSETAPSGEVAVSTAPRLKARLEFDEDPGGPAVDSREHTRTAEMHGGVATTPGKTGRAIALDGKDGHVALPAGVVEDLSDFSITAWVRLDEDRTWSRVFDFGDDRGRSMFLTPRSSGGKARFAVGTVYGHNDQVIDGAAALPTARWTHVAVTLAARVGTLYVDGAEVGKNTGIDFPPFRLGRTPQNWIGRSRRPSDPYLSGKIDDFRIYDGALTANQVADLAKAASAPAP